MIHRKEGRHRGYLLRALCERSGVFGRFLHDSVRFKQVKVMIIYNQNFESEYMWGTRREIDRMACPMGAPSLWGVSSEIYHSSAEVLRLPASTSDVGNSCWKQAIERIAFLRSGPF